MENRVFLWEPGNVPLKKKEDTDEKPYLELFLLDNGKVNPCVIVIPGGAYRVVSNWNEGEPIAKLLNSAGYSAVILNYRVSPYGYPAQLTDLKRAVRLTRSRAAEWRIDPGRLGLIGFSAGAHLAMTGTLAFDEQTPDVGDEIDAYSARPDNAALCYGVLSLDPAITHAETRKTFLCGAEDEALAFRFSAENRVRKDAPPIFLMHTSEDPHVDARNSLRFAEKCVAEGIPVTLYLFPYGQHGIGLGEGVPLAEQWGELYVRWLDEMNK